MTSDVALEVKRVADALEGMQALLASYLRVTIRTSLAAYESMDDEAREAVAPLFAELQRFLDD